MGPGSDNPGYDHADAVNEVLRVASMGPGSDNPGYGHVAAGGGVAQVAASMGPGSDNPGYERIPATDGFPERWLQWVRGPITPVMIRLDSDRSAHRGASMGPGSDNPGYAAEATVPGAV